VQRRGGVDHRRDALHRRRLGGEVIVASGVSMQFGPQILFSNVTVKFGGGNRYGLIGANGCGKSTLIRILGGDLEPSGGNVALDPYERLGKLEQALERRPPANIETAPGE
jgi:ATPase subunit of ABC transporter with duplicated ATPase domains